MTNVANADEVTTRVPTRVPAPPNGRPNAPCMPRARYAPNADVARRSPADCDDVEVVRLIQQGDWNAACRMLMERQGHAVYRYCHVYLQNPALAEDTCQRIFIEVFEKLKKLQTFEPRAPLRAWLFTIARRRMLDALRHRRREEAHLSRADAGEAPDLDQPGFAAVRDLRMKHALTEILARLPEELQRLVYLRFQEELSYDEIAALVGEPAGTLQRRMTRALPSLRRRIMRVLDHEDPFDP